MNFSNICIIPKLGAENAPSVEFAITKIRDVAYKFNIPIIFKFPNEQSLVIAVGGDGTMLEAMRMAALMNTIVMGVNLGKVGFLTDFTVDIKWC